MTIAESRKRRLRKAIRDAHVALVALEIRRQRFGWLGWLVTLYTYRQRAALRHHLAVCKEYLRGLDD